MKSFIQSLLFILVVAGVVFYFFGNPKWIGLEKMPFSGKGSNSKTVAAKGCNISQQEYDKAAAFESLDLAAGDKLPAAASLLQFAPQRRSQGQQGSCVGWASSYAARTITEAVATGQNPNDLAFSPAFLYNQIGLEGCEGTYTIRALEHLQSKGVGFLSQFPYDENDCLRQPSAQQLEAAKKYKIRGFTRISKGGDNFDLDLDALKQNIAQGGCIIIAMHVPPSFSYAQGTETWQPESGEADNPSSHGGHAMCVIGYDDNKNGGSVQIMNSWGDYWGKDGVIWVSYKDFLTFTREGYAVFPSASNPQVSKDQFQVAFGLQKRENNQLTDFIPLKKVGKNSFATRQPLEAGESFKIVVENSKDCYVYIFGLETDESTYVLFPYKKTSPYFGVTGTRTFPKNKSFTVDDLGTQDYMAIVATKEPIDENELNEAISNSDAGSFEARIKDALGQQMITDAAWKVADDAIMFDGNRAGGNALVAVFRIDKN